MSKVLIPILIGVAASATIIFFSLVNRKRLTGFINRLKFKNLFGHFNFSNLVNVYKKTPVSLKTNPEPSAEVSPELDLSILNCRVKQSVSGAFCFTGYFNADYASGRKSQDLCRRQKTKVDKE